MSRYDEAKVKYEKVSQSIHEKRAKAERPDAFAKTLKNREEALTEFDEGLWGTLADFVTVHGNGDIGVTFKDGTEIRIK